MSNQPTTTSLIARRTSKGFRADQSATMLAELIAAHDGVNLAYALHYNDFATARQADLFAGVAA